MVLATIRLSLFCGLLYIVLSVTSASCQNTTGEVVVRIDDSSGTHCIDATTEQVTIYLRRAFTEKKKGWFTENQARRRLGPIATLGEITRHNLHRPTKRPSACSGHGLSPG